MSSDPYDEVLSEEGPSLQELEAIEAEWPVIQAEIALLDEEIALISAGRDVFDWQQRRVRRAQRQVLTALRVVSSGPGTPTGRRHPESNCDGKAA